MKGALPAFLSVLPPETMGSWVAIHEAAAMVNEGGARYSENTLASRASDAVTEGLAVGRTRKGTSFREYARVVGAPRPQGLRADRKPTVSGSVVAVQTCLLKGREFYVVEAPKGKFQPGQQVRII